MGRLSKVGAAFLRLVAVAGPVLLGLLTALYVGRPSPYFLATGAVVLAGHGVLLRFAAPHQLASLAGSEHGRTIPLAVVAEFCVNL